MMTLCTSIQTAGKTEAHLQLPVPIHKLFMELRNTTHPVRTRGKERSSEMQCVRLLSESATGHDTDTRSVEEFQTIEFVGFLAFFFGSLDGFFGEVYSWEEVH